jgi:hypothetical protein
VSPEFPFLRDRGSRVGAASVAMLNFRSCQVDILEVQTVVNGNRGHRLHGSKGEVVLKSGATKS